MFAKVLFAAFLIMPYPIPAAAMPTEASRVQLTLDTSEADQVLPSDWPARKPKMRNESRHFPNRPGLPRNGLELSVKGWRCSRRRGAGS